MPIANSLSSLFIDPRSDLGIAAQIRARIAFLVADGELAPGERLPSVRDLAVQLGVNVNTIRAAYAELERDGLVRTRHGVGTVVLAAPPARLPAGVRPLGVNTVAVLIGGLNPFYLALLRGIEDVAAEQGTLVLIVDTRDSPPLAEALLRRLIPRGVDGIIAVSVGGLDNELKSRETDDGRLPPIVYVDQPDRKGHVLLFDGHAAGYAAAHHLREHGHERVGIITAPAPGRTSTRSTRATSTRSRTQAASSTPTSSPRSTRSRSKPDASDSPTYLSSATHPPRCSPPAKSSPSAPSKKHKHDNSVFPPNSPSAATPTRPLPPSSNRPSEWSPCRRAKSASAPCKGSPTLSKAKHSAPAAPPSGSN
jgi:DNA-binding transcriptional regulator YhcF (GntR family)